MRYIITAVAVALMLATSLGAPVASAAPGDTFKAKKAACKAKANQMSFGVHLVKKNRWVKDCIAGKHPA
jgi:hypothetical protein